MGKKIKLNRKNIVDIIEALNASAYEYNKIKGAEEEYERISILLHEMYDLLYFYDESKFGTECELIVMEPPCYTKELK